MKNLKSILFSFSLFALTACSGQPLFDPNASASLNPPEGKVFVQVAFQTIGDPDGLVVGDYEIHLTKAAFVMGNVSPVAPAVNSQILRHVGEDHGGGEGEGSEEDHTEPSSCPFDGSLSQFFYLDLIAGASLPCFTLDEGSYAGVHFEFHPPQGTVEGLPAGFDGSIWVMGEAHKGPDVYPFELKGNLEEAREIAEPFSLTADDHHITVHVDFSEWFHGMDFAILDQEGGVVLLDQAHNTERYEHFLEHFVESFFLLLPSS